MEFLRQKNSVTLIQSAVLILLGFVGLYAVGYFDPLPPRAATQANGVFLYYGEAGETIPAEDAESSHFEVAQTALADADYYGAFAVGPNGRTGVWTGAYTRDLAQRYAVASCGTDCTVVAERVPLHRDTSRDEPVLTSAMARNLAVQWPFTNDYIALGGAGSWGHRPKPAGKTGRKIAMRKAAADCELRRAAENPPNAALSEPCVVQRISDIEDLRPKAQLYPAAFTVELMEMTPVEEAQIFETEGAPSAGLFGYYLPKDLHGARATNGASAVEFVRRAGWPEAGKTAALTKCNASRRPGEPACMVSHVRQPETDMPNGVLAVRPELYESFTVWQATQGAGAFAVGPYGAWGTSYNFEDVAEAKQRAADWCWHYTRKSWEYRQIDRSFLDPGLSCRIVAVRQK